ncbi:ion channel [Sphingomonas cavernae]|uniref:Two pore domain potassium channel family protein n=1 Tax=Sphingomonas cavernae TaxID=2320861 RepID=A0A418WSP1_9SPHN|nr:ion channel [Sphingomonas cavernae]RJF94280.1 two pore domain potassium channel family protein [Sphingomonas cavernae]
MLLHLLIGLVMLVLCLSLQAVFVTVCLRRYARFRIAYPSPGSRRLDFMLLSMVMLLMLLGNFVQIAIWAGLFMLLGEFDEFTTALYHSGVNYAGLGYGDIVMSERWRLFGPLEAANGIMMFGLSTAVMTAGVMDVVKYSNARLKGSEPPAGGYSE